MTNSSAISYDKFVRMTDISVSIKGMKCAKTEMSSYQIYGGPIGFLSWWWYVLTYNTCFLYMIEGEIVSCGRDVYHMQTMTWYSDR